MPKLVVMGAQMSCTGSVGAPSSLVVAPLGPPVTGSNMAAATIMHFAPIVNIPPFGMCKMPSNPAVASATAAAAGALTPMPCVPVIPAPWAPGAAKTLINNQPALTDSSKCMCAWGGQISITSPGQGTVDVS